MLCPESKISGYFCTREMREKEVSMEKSIQLQDVGKRHAINTAELQIGDTILWNFGYKSQVVGIHPTKSGKQIDFDLKSTEDEVVRTRRMGRNRLVAIENIK